MKLYGAIDLHSNNNVTVLIDEQDKVVYEKRLPNDLAMITEQLSWVKTICTVDRKESENSRKVVINQESRQLFTTCGKLLYPLITHSCKIRWITGDLSSRH